MTTHEEWFVGVKKAYQFKYDKQQKWMNAMCWFYERKRYADSEEEAKKVLNKAYEMWNGEKVYNEKGERYDTESVGCIGITTVSTKETDAEQKIVEHIIRKRTVTDWETVEKK